MSSLMYLRRGGSLWTFFLGTSGKILSYEVGQLVSFPWVYLFSLLFFVYKYTYSQELPVFLHPSLPPPLPEVVPSKNCGLMLVWVFKKSFVFPIYSASNVPISIILLSWPSSQISAFCSYLLKGSADVSLHPCHL